MKNTATLSSSGLQFPLLADVKISTTLPAVRSLPPGIYVALSVVLLGVNVPPPSVVQTPLPVVDVPFNAAFGLFTQTEIVAPAFTRGASVMVTAIVFVTARQSPLPVVVRTMFTLPAAVSAALGVYVVLRLVVLPKVPVPEEDQVPPVATVTEPLRVTSALLAQTV